MKRALPSPAKSKSSPTISPARKIVKAIGIACLDVDPINGSQNQSHSPSSNAHQHADEELIIDEAITYVDSHDIDSCSDCNDHDKKSSLHLTSLDLHHNIQESDKQDHPNDDGATFNNITITENHSAVQNSENTGPLYPNALFKVPSDLFDTVEKIFIMGGMPIST